MVNIGMVAIEKWVPACQVEIAHVFTIWLGWIT
jgi:hypothetical protein